MNHEEGARDGEPVTGEGTCVYAGLSHPCTWYGYSFEYTLPKPAVISSCKWSSSERSNLGNPSSVQRQNVKDGTYELELRSDRSFFFNPQYIVASRASLQVGKVSHVTQSCSYEGQQVFEVAFNLQFPER